MFKMQDMYYKFNQTHKTQLKNYNSFAYAYNSKKLLKISSCHH